MGSRRSFATGKPPSRCQVDTEVRRPGREGQGRWPSARPRLAFVALGPGSWAHTAGGEPCGHWLLSPAPASLPFAILTLVNAPYKRGFYCGDDSIRYPYRPDTITHGLMAGVTITATVVLVRQERLGGW